ncbi:MAG TPA: acyltransferase family protein [Dehalococcoidia bacterium]
MKLRKVASAARGQWQRTSQALLAAFHVGPASTTEVATIDGLRALAVTGVVVLHCWGIAGGPALNWTLPLVGATVFVGGWIHQGELGITLFFILSGFLLAQPFLRSHYSEGRRPPLKSYFSRRILRLVPAYYVCLILSVLLMTPAWIDPKQVYSVFGLQNLAAHLTFTQFWFIDTAAAYRVDASMWTLTHEATFYVVLPFVAVFFAGRRSLVALPAALAISIGWLWLAHHSLDFFVNWVWRGMDDKLFFSHETIRNNYVGPQFPAHAFNFALGIGLANVFVAVQMGRLRRPGQWPALALFVAGCATLFAWVHFGDFHNSPITNNFAFVGTPFEAVGIALVLAGLVFGAPGVRQAFSFVPVRIIGIISYSAFLWHGPILFAVEHVHWIAAQPPERKLGLLLLTVVPLTLVVSVASYLLVEKPFLRSARRPARPAPKPSPETESAPEPRAMPATPTLELPAPNTPAQAFTIDAAMPPRGSAPML